MHTDNIIETVKAQPFQKVNQRMSVEPSLQVICVPV